LIPEQIEEQSSHRIADADLGEKLVLVIEGEKYLLEIYLMD
jgi:hypothetical protein